MRRSLFLFLTLLLLWAGTRLLNDFLAPAHLTVFVGGLFVAYAALNLPLADGLVATLLAGGVCDAGTPLRFGTQILLFASAHVLIFACRDRLPHEHGAGRLGIVLGANGAIFVALALLQSRAPAGHAALWPRLAADLCGSELFLALAAPWFLALQEHALALAPADPDRMY